MVNSKVSVESFKPMRGVCWLIVGLFMSLSLLDYHPELSKFYSLGENQWLPGNRLGTLGVHFCFYGGRYLGLMVWLLPIYALWLGITYLMGRCYKVNRKKIVCFFLCLLSGSTLFSFLQAVGFLNPRYQFYSAGMGGFLGNILFTYGLKTSLGSVGSALLLIPLTLFSLCLAFASMDHLWTAFYSGIKWSYGKVYGGLGYIFWRIKCSLSAFFCCQIPGLLKKIKLLHFTKKEEQSTVRPILKVDPSVPKDKDFEATSSQPFELFQTPQASALDEGVSDQEAAIPIVSQSPKKEAADPQRPIQILASAFLEKANEKPPTKSGNYCLPSLNLLKDPPPVFNSESAEDYYETANNLVQKLAEFGVEVTMEAIQSGPVITRYEVTPARGVRVEKIATLDKNIALGLKALSVRIQAPVPGKGCVGIEVPNKKPLPVCLKEILASKAWEQTDAEIPIVLGKEVTGKPIVADLTKMPHLLIAGSTGSGKTVCINAIIASLLFRATPQDLRFIMVDPKIVEMKIYNDLPHMLIPVVTDPKRVPSALKWLIAEMERRYQLFADYGARNIATFNAKIRKLTVEECEKNHLSHLPYIVCIVDELADLMMVAPGDIETCIARLAQLARAAGIHLIIATQRPSVNVITGIIKANLPSRIAFKVASKVDSRTILDTGGADSLIGKGDMLFIPPGASQLVRAQGAWVSDEEITQLVEFLKCNGSPEFAEDVQQMVNEDSEESMSMASDPAGDDLIPQALAILKTSDRISTSLLQRRLKIGYNRAARIMEELDRRGLVPKNSELG